MTKYVLYMLCKKINQQTPDRDTQGILIIVKAASPRKGTGNLKINVIHKFL